MFQVSLSKIDCRRACQQRYVYRYVDKLQAKVKARPLQFGTIIHKMLEAHAEERDPFKTLAEIAKTDEKLFKEEEEMYGRIIADAKAVFQGYLDFWRKEPLQYLQIKDFEQYAEHRIEDVEIAKGITFTGRIDGLVKSRRLSWLIEHKTHKDFPNQDHRWRNLQSAVYLRVVDMLGWCQLTGTLWNYIRSKPPTHMRPMEKTKGMSVREIDSLPHVVEADIVAAGYDPKNYAGFINQQRERVHSWYERIYTPVKQPVIYMLWCDFVTTARQMRDEWEDGDLIDGEAVRTIGRHCDWCEFEPLCRAALTGADIDFVKEHEFEPRKKEVEEEKSDG